MAQRLTRRLYPDIAQSAVVADLIIPQSRITFSGPTGLVLFFYQGRITNASAVAQPELTLRLQASIGVGSLRPWIGFLGGGIGVDMEYWVRGFALDPPVGGFVELFYDFSVGSIDFPANGGNFYTISFPTEEGGGPIVTVE